MPANFTNLTAAIEEAVAQATASTTLEGSATALLKNVGAAQEAAVTAALQADDAADQGSIDVAVAAIKDTTAKYVASAGPLGEAIAANTPPPPPARRG